MAEERDSAARFLPPDPTLADLRRAAAGCTACDLHERGTQTVFGEGPEAAPVMLVGEQPGDVEDQTGHPFTGPAGKLLDRCLEAAGIGRDKVYVTNTVKHFKWEAQGKRRLHSKPNAAEIRACMPWLEAEIALVRPKLILCLGATAAQALLGKQFRVTRDRGLLFQSQLGPQVMATLHPSALLRMPDEERREAAIAGFIEDLRKILPYLG